MKIIESYKDLKILDVDAKKTIYKKIHETTFKKKLNKILPNGKSVWIDSAGVANKNRYIFENGKWKGIFKSKKIKYYKDFFSPTLMQAIKKYIHPNFMVLNNCEEFRYLTPDQFTAKLEIISNFYQIKIFICFNTILLDFNKLKYTNIWIIKKIIKNFSKYKIHKVDYFHYIYELN